jgi:glutathione S-transferase
MTAGPGCLVPLSYRLATGEFIVKLYYHPASTTSRPVVLFAAETGIALELQIVDLFTGAHLQESFAVINPNRMVPVLEDGDFRMSESSAILKYLADKVGSPAYPKDLKKRAKVNEMMDWFNSNLYRDYAYGLIYPQVFPHHKRPSEAVQAATIAWGKEKTKAWLQILDKDLIGTKNKYLCGNEISIADYFGAAIIEVGKVIGCDLSAYPNLDRWLGGMRKLKHWPEVHKVFYGFADSMRGQRFEAI